MGYNFDEFEVGDSIRKALSRAKIGNTEHLINTCATAAAREDISRATGLDVEVLRKFACAADMLRIASLGPGAARLLQAAGVESVKALRKQDAEALTRRLADTNDKTKPPIMKRLPKVANVTSWIAGAVDLEARVKC